MKIIEVGPFPPPYGGVSNHLFRLKSYLDKTFNECVYWDTTKISIKEKVCKYKISGCWSNYKVPSLLFKRSAIIHFHEFSVKLFLLNYFLLSLKHHVIISFHNERFIEEIESKGHGWVPFFRHILNRMGTFIVDNKNCYQKLEKVVKDKKKIFLIPEFIPPSNIPPLAHNDVLALRRNHNYLFSSNAWKVSFYKNQDLYGIDLLVEALEILHHKYHQSVATAFLLPSIGDEKYFQKIMQKIKSCNLEDHFYFITESLEEASSLWNISDLIIRATNTDGNSITILEAMALGKAVLASDCVERPKGVLLFKSRSVESLVEKINDFITNREKITGETFTHIVENNAEKFISLYQSIINRDKI
jgi:glycosyltransferase involved in cell wall biosynthesis